jgi:hypothetical protein
MADDKRLRLILTKYGLDRINKAVSDPSLNLNLTKIKMGSGDENEDYYEPSENQEELKSPIKDAEFYIYNKELLEDGLTISFHTIITEEIGGFDIREVGLYETLGGKDFLFAISTQQPFVKPSPDYNYYINLDYYMFIKSTKFAEVYDQITLDVEHALVTEADMEELMRTFLFAQGNLMDQIGNNSRIIGYNRATQLYEKIEENKKDFGYITLYKNYASVIDMVPSVEDIFSYWAFNYSRRKSVGFSIVDISKNGYDLSTNKSSNLYEQEFNGFMSLLNFEAPDYYKLSSQIPLNLSSSSLERDLPFTVVCALEPNTPNSNRTILAKVNKSTNTATLQIQEMANGSIKVVLYSDMSHYATFTSDENVIPQGAHSIVLAYSPETRTSAAKVVAYVNAEKYILSLENHGYSYMKELPGTLYKFQYTPTIYVRQTDENTYILCNKVGSQEEATEWEITSLDPITVTYNGEVAVAEPTKDNIIPLYKWTYEMGEGENGEVYTSAPTVTPESNLYDNYYEKISQVPTGEIGLSILGNKIFYYNGIQSYEAELVEGYVYDYVISCYQYPEGIQDVWTNSSSSPTLLYTKKDGSYELLVKSDEWKIENQEVFYNGKKAEYTDGTDQTYYPDLTSYIIDENGNIIDNIDAKIGLLSIIKAELSEGNNRALALNLCATMGKNPYMSNA